MPCTITSHIYNKCTGNSGGYNKTHLHIYYSSTFPSIEVDPVPILDDEVR